MKINYRIVLTMLGVMVAMDRLDAQWVQTTGASGAVVTNFAIAGSNLYAATTTGVFLSTNTGLTWGSVNTGLTNTNVTSVAGLGTTIFAGTTTGVFLSTTNGLSWNAIDSGLTNKNIRALAVSGTNLIAGTAGGVFVSAVNGSGWKGTKETDSINALAVSGSLIIAAPNGNIVSTTDNGATWNPMNAGMSQTVGDFAVYGNALFAGTPTGVYRSNLEVPSWSLVGTGLPNISALAVSDITLFAGTTSGVYFTTVSGTSWTAANTQLPRIAVTSFIVYGTNLIAGTNGGGIWRRPLSEMTTSVEKPLSGLPVGFVLEQNYPNPFNPSTTINFATLASGMVKLTVYNVLGQEMVTLVHQDMPAGRHTVSFDASRLSSGAYFYRLEAGTYTSLKRMILMK